MGCASRGFSPKQRLFSLHGIAYIASSGYRLCIYVSTSDSAVLSFLNAFLTSPYFKDPIWILSILQISVKDSFLYKGFLADSAAETTSPSFQLIQTQEMVWPSALTAVIPILCPSISWTRSGALWRGKALESGRPRMRGSWEGLRNPSKLHFPLLRNKHASLQGCCVCSMRYVRVFSTALRTSRNAKNICFPLLVWVYQVCYL